MSAFDWKRTWRPREVGNGAGKSTVLRAIDRFYSTFASVELDDFFGRNIEQPIEIELTFTALDAREQELFGSRVHDGEMSVVRVFDANRNSGHYYGKSPQHLPFAGIRSVQGANEKRAAYNALRLSGSALKAAVEAEALPRCLRMGVAILSCS